MSNVDSKTIILNFLFALLFLVSQKILLLKLTFQKNFVVFLSCFWTGHLAGQLSHWFFWKIQQHSSQSSSLLVVYSWTRPLCVKIWTKIRIRSLSGFQPAMAAPFPVTGVNCENRQLRHRWQQSGWDGHGAGRLGQASAAGVNAGRAFSLLWLWLLLLRPPPALLQTLRREGARTPCVGTSTKKGLIQGTVPLRWRYCLAF